MQRNLQNAIDGSKVAERIADSETDLVFELVEAGESARKIAAGSGFAGGDRNGW